MRIGWPRRVSAQVLAVQLALTAGVTVLATGLFLAPLASELDDQAMHRALVIAQTAATDRDLARDLTGTPPTVGGPVQARAETIRRATGALYVVVMDTRGIRWSHTNPREVGRHVSTDPATPLSGREIMQIDTGTLGRSARAKVPLYGPGHRLVGAVSVGIGYDSVHARLLASVPGLLRYAGAALAAGALAAVLVARGLRRRTHGVAFTDISALLDEREAMLHGIREGVVACDRHGRIRLVNDEAARLLDLPADAVGRLVTEVLPRGRTVEVLAGRVDGADLLAVSAGRVLVVNRMPTADEGAVITLRDRTELDRLGRELDGTQGLLDALRAQAHEHANRLHTVLGLIEIGRPGEAAALITEVAHTGHELAERLAEHIHEPLLSALLAGKAAIAAERGAELRLAPGTSFPAGAVDPRDLVTVLGNLVDNALDAVTGHPRRDPFVEVELHTEGTTAVLRVADTGPGVPPGDREAIFTEGWSTKPGRGGAQVVAVAAVGAPGGPGAAAGPPGGGRPAHGRGIGLALVRRLAERYGGTARVAARPGGGALFTVVLPEALAPGAGDTPAPPPTTGPLPAPVSEATAPGGAHPWSRS
ncbi:ATP-binding protein [Streptomyces sp. NPDC050560]|uniref:sensor histidine kinase n=1 Tax=Streptomyces sp. NPDC050560 TaxID=3365630 RepID=UPI00379681DF